MKHLALLTYFRALPLGMTRYERLASSSLSVAQRQCGSIVLLGPAHVVAPWRFKHYYPLDWLEHVTRQDVVSFCGVFDATGRLQQRIPLPPSHTLHSSLDLVKWENVDGDFVEPLDWASAQPSEEDDWIASGVTLADSVQGNLDETIDEYHLEGDFAERMMPTIVSARHNRHVGRRRFVATESVLAMGMCGGAVTVKGTNRAVGMIEAVASPGNADSVDDIVRDVTGNAALIDASLINDFVND